MTKRRLANKKAYDEIMLLHKLLPNDQDNSYEIFIEVDRNGYERYVVYHSSKLLGIKMIKGKDYVEISKNIIEYLDKL